MGKRIIQQRRGKGSLTYQVRTGAYKFKIGYPTKLIGEGKVLRLINSKGHTTPLAKIKYSEGTFYIPAFNGMVEGQTIKFEQGEIKDGNILRLKNLPIKTKIYNIESRPGDGGKFIRTSGNYAEVSRISDKEVFVMLPSKKERKFNAACRAIVGVIAGAGRLEKPILKAGKMHYIKKSKNRLWPRTSAIKMNAIDHPFGSGRGKRIKSKIAKRNAPAGARVGLIRPRRTGKKK